MSTYTWDGNNFKLTEHYLYGSARLGSLQVDKTIDELKNNGYGQLLGSKRYEITNHLGNVQAVISDNRTTASNGFTYCKPDIVQTQDYYPFGMLMPGRSVSTNIYKFGFNGKENDNEVMGIGNSLDFGERIYNPRTATFFSLDPKIKEFPFISPYVFAADNPILFIDKNGEDWEITVTKVGKETNVQIKLTTAVLYSSGRLIHEGNLAKAVKTQVESTFTKDFSIPNEDYDPVKNPNVPVMGEFISVKYTVDVRIIKDKSELKANEHLVEVLPEVKSSSGNIALGQAQYYGKTIKLNYSDILNMTVGDLMTIPHEFGHTGGLKHPDKDVSLRGLLKGEQYLPFSRWNNFMFTTGTKKKMGGKGNENNLTLNQVNVLIKNYYQGKLNKK